MATAVGYIRTSTTNGVSLEAQRLRIADKCLKAGVELVELREDAGLASDDATPNLQAAVNAVCATGGTLVVCGPQIISRSADAVTDILVRLAQSNASIAFA